MSDIFISYRRRDSEREAKRIYEWLTQRLGKDAVFMDLSSIGPGDDFRSTILREIDTVQIMLVIIGRQWCFAEDAEGRHRLDDPHDLVRQEITTALRSGIRIIPILVSDAVIPQADQLPDALNKLPKLNALRFRESSFESDIAHLADYLDQWMTRHSEMDSTASSRTANKKKVCMLGAYGVGKTSLVARFVKQTFSEKYLTTLGVVVSKKEMRLGETEFNMMLWDLAGEDSVTRIRATDLHGSAGFILVTDGRNSSFRAAMDIRQRLQGDLGSLPMVLAANKVDLYEESWEFTLSDLDETTENLGMTVFTTSAKTGKGVELMFQHLARQILKRSN